MTVASLSGSTGPASAGKPSAAAPPRPDLAATVHVPLLASDNPVLVPLETLPGRNHYDFPAAEAPPWQWQVDPRYPGWSS